MAIVRYVNTASTVGGSGTSKSTSGANRAYATLSAAITATSGLSDNIIIYCSGDNDPSHVFLASTDNTSLSIIGDGTYRLVTTAYNATITVSQPNVTIREIKARKSSVASVNITILNIFAGSGATNTTIENCEFSHGSIFRAIGTHMVTLSSNSSGAGSNYNTIFRNNYLYDAEWPALGIVSYEHENIYIHNNTIVNSESTGIVVSVGSVGSNIFQLINNLVVGSIGNDYTLDYGTVGTLTELTNLSSDATSPNSELINKSISFGVAPKLAESDTDAIKQGSIISSFSTDIYGSARPVYTNWDIGCHQFNISDEFLPQPPPPLKEENIYLVKLTLKQKKEPFTAQTFWASNRSYLEGELYSGSPHVFSGLIELGGFAQKMGEVLPLASSGSILFDNNRGTLAADKRWGDLVHYYAMYWQDVEVYLFTKYVDQQGDVDDLLLQFKGKIDDTKNNVRSNTFELGLTQDDLSRAKPQYKINSSDNPNAPDGSLGYPLPIVFGEDVQVPAVRITDNDSENTYAYATNLDSAFINGGLQKLYVKSSANDYVEIYTRSDFNSEFAFAKIDPLVGALRASLGWPNFTEVATGFGQDLYSTGFTDRFMGSGLTWGGKAYLHDSNSGVRDGYLIVRLYEGSSGALYMPEVQIDEVRIPMTNFVSLGLNVGWPVSNEGVLHEADFYWNKAHLIREGSWYWVSYSLNAPSDYATQNMQPLVSGAGLVSLSRQRGSGSDPNSDWENLTYPSLPGFTRLSVSVRACYYSDSPTGIPPRNSGLGGSSFTLSKPSSALPDLRDLELIVETDGIKDNSSGTITGTPSLVITRPQDAIKLLYYKQNGNSLSGFGFFRDESETNSALGATVLKGATTSEMPYREIMADILFASCSRMYPTLSGGYNFWTYAVTPIPAYELTDSDCLITNISTVGKGAIVNSVTINFDRRGIPLSLQDTQRENVNRNYRQSLIYEFGTGVIGSISYGSETLYDREELASRLENIDWFANQGAANRLASYILSLNTDEYLVIQLSIPAFKYNYRDIKIGDIIRLTHLDLPYEFGTAPDGVEKLPSLDGEFLENFNFREPWRRARSILTRVVAIAPEVSLDIDEPTINLVVEELLDKEARRP